MAGESDVLLLHIVPPSARTLRIAGFMRKKGRKKGRIKFGGLKLDLQDRLAQSG